MEVLLASQHQTGRQCSPIHFITAKVLWWLHSRVTLYLKEVHCRYLKLHILQSNLLQLGNIFKGMFQNTILVLRDNGILDKLKNDVMNPPIPILVPTVRHNQPLILRQLGIIMITLVVGASIATCIFFVELYTRPSGAPKFAEGIKLSERHEKHVPQAPQSQTLVVWM